MNTIEELISEWQDVPESHQRINNLFIEKTNEVPELKALRDYIESNIFGFGERSFYWMWKLICDTQDDDFTFLEIGVFRGQTLALIKLLKPNSKVYGITPLDSTDDHWESDYAADIKKLHDDFALEQPTIIVGLSTDETVIGKAIDYARYYYDVVYIDGGHSYEVVKWDVSKYPYMVKIGGYLVIDDCCNKYQIPNGMFPGITTVSQAVDEWYPNEDFKELFSVVHIRVFLRVK